MNDWGYRPAADLERPLAEQHASIRREGGLVSTGLHLAWRGLAGLYLRLAHRLEVRGLEHLPSEPPVVIAANHASHLDTPILCSILPIRWRDRVHPLAAGDTFFATPPRATLAALFLNALPIWRRRRVLRQDLGVLRERLVIDALAYVLFPEGTRTRTGALGPFKAGLGALVAGTDVPVVPAWLGGTYSALPPHRDLPRLCPLVVTLGPSLRFATTPDTRAGWISVRDEVERAVRALAPD